MKLYFIRHGKAGYNASSDEARQLTDVGIQQAKNSGKILKAMDVQATKIYCSPRIRALQTAQHIGAALNIEPEINDACNFDFSKDKAIVLASKFNDADEILFIGHNPSMSQVVHAITGARVELPTCTIACVTHFNPSYPDYAILKWLITAKMVSAMLESQDF